MKHLPNKKKGAKRILDYDKIRARIESGERVVDIAKDANCTSGHLYRLKKQWGLIPDRWAEVPVWY